MNLAKNLLRDETLSAVYQTVTFSAPGIYYPPYGRSAFLLQGQGTPGNYASGGNYANTNSPSGGNYAGSNPGTPGNYSGTNPGSGGNYAGTNPGSPGNYAGTNPGSGGNYAGTNPGSGGNYAGTNPSTGGNPAGTNPYVPGGINKGTLYQYFVPPAATSYNEYPGSDLGNYSIESYNTVPGYLYVIIYATYYNPAIPGNTNYNPVVPGNDYYNPYVPGNAYYNPYTPGNDYYNPYVPGNDYYNPYYPGNPNYNPYIPGNDYYNPYYPGNPNYNPYYPGNPAPPNSVLGVTLPGGSADSSAPVVGYVPVVIQYTNAGTPISVPTGGYIKIQNTQP
jgi:hypothetical protein